ncbi:FAD-dependent oxidoreductase [Pseudoflavonifractor sp.]|uniref:FAD-dependent oxidoreductase n=1 Tax=Pseudoflavonifractor sp. TaxID=1980281 RepID=UPI003D8A3D87
MELYKEMIHNLPIIRKADVVILGSGPTGICAAAAASLEGAKTLLIRQKSDVDGTAAVAERFGRYMTGSSAGFYEELLKWTRRMNQKDSKAGRNSVTCRRAKNSASGMGATEENAEVLLSNTACAPIMHGELLRGVIIENKNGRQAILAKIVIDCTGDNSIITGAGLDEAGCWQKSRSKGKRAIPWGCLVTEKADGLILAEQNFRDGNMAQYSCYAMSACIRTGQSMGVAAAICARELILPRRLDVKKLRARLTELGIAP